MDASIKCDKCGSTNLEPGRVQGYHPFQFYPAKKKPGKWLPAHVPISGTACLDCGAITLHADPEKLKSSVQ
jgi:hypothetical protein